MSETEVIRRLAAILAADVVGYSRMMAEDEAGTLAALRSIWAELFNPLVGRHRGRVVKMMGDGALVEFGSAVDAVQCAVAIQQAMQERREGGRPVQFRIGVNLGEIVSEGDDIFGDGVNVAARLEGQAPPGGILISDAVHSQVRGKINAAFADGGEMQLKNIDRPVRVWRLGEASTERRPPEAPAAAPREKPSVAVLPFSNLSNDPEQEFFADGLVDDILTTLSKLSGLTVIARNSSFAYKGRAVDVRQAGKELGARYVLEGSVRKGGNRIRVTAQLIDTESGAHLWAERYDRNVEDIFSVQDEITLILATEMQVKLTEGEQARMRYSTTSNVQAWNLWAQGLHYYRNSPVARDGVGQARPLWERALELDPDSAALNAMLGFLAFVDARHGWWDDRETALRKGSAYIERALSLDPLHADAHLTSGLILLVQGRHDEAVAAVRRALELAPNGADVASFSSFVLSSSGLHEEAIFQIEKALRLSPNYPANYLGQLGNTYRFAGRVEESIAAFKAYAERRPGFGHADLAILYLQSGRPEDAQTEIKNLLAVRPNYTVGAFAATQFRKDAAAKEADLAALRAAGLPE
jgi:adenylate cyclase